MSDKDADGNEDMLEIAVKQVIANIGISQECSQIKYKDYERMAISFLEPQEYIILASLQSRWNKLITPHLLLLTNKKLMLLDPSYLNLHYGITLFKATSIDNIPYNSIKNVKLTIGMLFSTITLKMIGGINEIVIHGIEHKDARLVSSVLEGITGRLV
jgi:hypothetical protein